MSPLEYRGRQFLDTAKFRVEWWANLLDVSKTAIVMAVEDAGLEYTQSLEGNKKIIHLLPISAFPAIVRLMTRSLKVKKLVDGGVEVETRTKEKITYTQPSQNEMS